MVECVEVNLKGIARSIDFLNRHVVCFFCSATARVQRTTTTKRRVLQKSVCNTDTLPLVFGPLVASYLSVDRGFRCKIKP